MNADPDDIARLNVLRIYVFESFINENWISEEGRRSSGNHIHPPRRDDRSTKGRVARIDEVNLHFRGVCPVIQRIGLFGFISSVLHTLAVAQLLRI